MKNKPAIWPLSGLFLGLIVLFSCDAGSGTAGGAGEDPFQKQIDSLLAKMTLEEKIGQMNQYNGTWDVTGPAPESGGNKTKLDHVRAGLVGSMLNVLTAEATREAQRIAVEESRLGIPLIFGYDVIHGYRTMFPIPLAVAASWDLAAIERSSRVAATEAAAAGIHWTFAPMVDITRDARWGRIMESAGEDPYLCALIAAAHVRGFQGEDLSAPNTIAACAKHFAAYGFTEAGRDYNTIEITEHTLRNIVLPPFKACVDAGVATFMNAFNEIGGVPATANAFLQRDILKGEWNFDGFVVSDYASIAELMTHGIAKDTAEAARLAAIAGSDMDMEGGFYVNALAGLVRSGAVDERHIDDAVRRILRIKFRLGLFDDPYRYCSKEREEQELLRPEHLEAAREVARKSMVLLKNDNEVLPLRKDLRSIAVIGPLAADKDVPLGSWRAQAVDGSAVSLLEGIQAAVSPQTQVLYAQGASLGIGKRSFIQELAINSSDKSGFAEALAVARRAEVVVLAIGEDCWQSGESRSRTDIGLPGVQEDLLREVYKVNKNIVIVLMNGRPLVFNWAADNVPAILEAWHLGSEAGHAIADVLFGEYNPSGKLPVSFPESVGQIPVYYNHKNTGRPANTQGNVFWSHFIDAPNTPRFPFGFGLSYTTFGYGNPVLSKEKTGMDEPLTVSIEVTNTGQRAGEEVVQLYIRDVVGSVTRPVRELKGFQKLHFEPGEKKTVTFTITSDQLAFWTEKRGFAAEPGQFQVFVGGNSRDVREATFELQ